MKFEEDFDFETANAQFNKDEIDKELQNKLKLKGTAAAVDTNCGCESMVTDVLKAKSLPPSLQTTRR